jgi:hypothetical protein
LISTSISELGQKLQRWLEELYYGCTSASELRLRDSNIRVRLWTDAYDLFEAVRCPRSYSGRGPSLHLFVEGLKEDIRTRRVHEYGWCPTDSMLADAMTKGMVDTLITKLMLTARWTPSGYEIMQCEDMPLPLGSSREQSSSSTSSSTKEDVFWTCTPGCSNCVLSVANELSIQQVLQRETPLGTYFSNASASEGSVGETPSTLVSAQASPSIAQVALATLYLRHLEF